jgi:hypothetical protein
MDLHRLQTAVFEKTGIRLDHKDPVFALVALNEVVVADLLAAAQEQWAQNNVALDARIDSLVKIHDEIMAASRSLAGRVDQAHLAAALKAATEAKAEIFKSARDAISSEVSRSAVIVSNSVAQLEAAQRDAKSCCWGIAILQAVIGGMVAALTVLTVMAVR